MATQEDKQYFRSGVMAFVFLYSFNRFSHYFSQNSKVKREIKKLRDIPVKNPSDAIQEASQQGKTNIYFYEGIPKSGKLVSTFKNVPLIMRVKQRDALFSIDAFQEPKIRFDWREAALSSDCTVDREPFFVLQDKFNKCEAQVSINDGSNVETALISLGFKDQKRSLSFAEHLGNFFTVFYSSAIKVLGPASLVWVLFRDSSFRGVHIGYRDNEFGIRAEGLLSVLGQAVYDPIAKKLTIENPLALTVSKTAYVYYLEKKSDQNQVAFNFWLVVSFLSGLYLSRRIYLYNKKHPQYWQKIKKLFQKLFKRKTQIAETVQKEIPDEKKAQDTPTQI